MEANTNTNMDAVDVAREGDKAARRVSSVTGMPLALVRACALSSVKDSFNIAVRYEGVPNGSEFRAAWVRGWRFGFGFDR